MTEYPTDYCDAPLTPGHWLRRSLGWTFGCLVGTWLFNQLQYNKYMSESSTNPHAFKMLLVLAFSSCCVAHCLIWWLALGGNSGEFNQKQHRDTFSWVALAAELWRGVLLSFQLISVALLLLLLLVVLLVVGEVDIAPHFG